MLTSLPLKQLLFTYTADVQPRYMQNSSGGMDLLLNVVSGVFEGEKLRGKLAADFCSDTGVMTAAGSIRSEVHLLLETDDGAEIHMNYRAHTVAAADGSFSAYNLPYFETSAENYSWLNTVQALTVYNFPEQGETAEVRCDVYELG